MVSRGGAYCDPKLDCRLASRRHYVADERSPRLGFRLVRAVTSLSSARVVRRKDTP